MSTREQFLPNVISRSPKVLSIANDLYPDAAVTTGATSWSKGGLMSIPNVLSGVCTAATKKTILSISGAGVLNLVALHHKNGATSTDHTITITIDGVAVATQTVTISVADHGMVTVGNLFHTGTTSTVADYINPILDQIPFNTSLLIEYTSSLTATDKAQIFYKYRTV